MIISKPINELAARVRLNSPAITEIGFKLFSLDDAVCMLDAMRVNTHIRFVYIETFCSTVHELEIAQVKRQIQRIAMVNEWDNNIYPIAKNKAVFFNYTHPQERLRIANILEPGK
jgi:hypothetical protein